MQNAACVPAAFSTSELAALLDVSRQAVLQKASRKKWKSIERRGQGGGVCWLFESMDEDSQNRTFNAFARVQKNTSEKMTPEELALEQARIDSLAECFARKTQKARDRAQRRMSLLTEAVNLVEGGMRIMQAFALVGKTHGVHAANLRNWYYGTDKKPGVRKLPRHEWLYALMDHYVGRQPSAMFTEEAKDYFFALYLHKKSPDLTDCYRRTVEAAPQHGWDVPSERTVRRIAARNPLHQMKFLRGKDKDMRDFMPPQTRDHTVFEAGEAINGDGLHLDMWTEFAHGEVVEHPVLWVWQDIRSSKLLAWDLKQSESTDVVRLSLYNLLGDYAPRHVWIDNTPAAANKLVTGTAPNRHRFKNQIGDTPGLLQLSEIEVHFTSPDHKMSSPGSKPVERAFGKGGIHHMIRNNPRIRDLGTLKKPVPVALLLEVVAEEVARFNARKGRRGMGMHGKSFDQAFAESFTTTRLIKVSPFTRRLFLLNQEAVTVRKDGLVTLNAGRGEGKNEYWSEVSSQYATRKMAVFYDPEDLTKDVFLCTLDGSFVGSVQYKPSVAFTSKEEGKKYAKTRGARLKAEKKAAEALIKMTDLEAQQFSNKVEAAPILEPASKVTRLGKSETNKMMSGTLSQSYSSSVKNMQRKIAALG